MNELPRGRPEGELVSLTHGYCNGTLNNAEFERLERLLGDNPEARSFFRRYLALDATLRDYGENAAAQWLRQNAPATDAGAPRRDTSAQAPAPPAASAQRNHNRVANEGRAAPSPGDSPSAPPPHTPVRKPLSHRQQLVEFAVVAATLVTCAIIMFNHRADANVIGRLEQVAGDVRVLGADGKVRAIDIDADVPLRSGDSVRTRGAQSSTAVVYPDGTRLTLVGDTSVTCGDQRSQNVVVHHGTLAVSVQGEKPMLLVTPAAQVQVLAPGTRFLIEALANRTNLSVSEGRVRLVRVRDGEAIDVPRGTYTVITEQNPLIVKDVPGLPVDWEASFEDGLPDGWETGKLVNEDLPPGSLGAVGTVREENEDAEGGVLWVLRSNNAWLQGLFAARKNSHLHFTYRMERPRWINVFFQTRTADPGDLRFSANYLFNDLPTVPAGRWHTASIPLSRFDRLAQGEPSLEELVPFRVMISSDADRGLVIDRIWVTSDGPGEVEIKPLD